MKKVGVLIAPGFEEVEAVTPIDLLRRAGINVVVIGIGGIKIRGSHNIEISCDSIINSNGFEDLDGVVIPGGMPGAQNISESENAMNLIKNMNSKNGLIAAICASPGVVLGNTGILDGKKFTCYPGFEDRVSRGVHLLDRVVHTDNIITSMGPGTAMEFSLEIIRYFLGSEKYDAIAKALLHPRIF